MSFAAGLFPRLAFSGSRACARGAAAAHLRPSAVAAASRPFARTFASASPAASPLTPARSAFGRVSRTNVFAIGLGLSVFTLTGFSSVHAPTQCDTAAFPASGNGGYAAGARQPAPAESMLDLYQLSFGAVCGICAGVFIKKGLRAIAFLLGGAFVLMQYMSSRSFITVDWSKLSSRYDSVFGTRTASGGSKAPTVSGVWNRLVDFLTANFQQRASFLAGLALGIRLG